MKSKMKRRMLAIVLCMVIVLSNSSFIFASSESGTPAVEAASTEGTTSQTETDTQVTEPTPQTLAVSESTPAPTDEPAAPTSVEATPTPTDTPEVTTTPEPTGTPTPEATPTPTDTPETTPTPEPTDAPEITTTPELTDTPEATTTPEPTNTPEATPTPTQGPENGTSDTVQPTAIPTPTEAPVKSNEAVELKQEFKDSDGNVTSTVKAQIPEGTFAADASEITMEVQTPDTASAEHVKEMMEELLPENHMLGDYIFYDIQFKVNGTVTEPQKPITITFEGNELSVKDVKRANVFWLDPEDPQVDGDKDQLVEITQKSEMIENLQNSGQSTENIDDYDLSEITLKEDGTSDKIQMEGRTSTIYGCYVVYEPVQVLTYDDDQVTVTVSAAEEGIIPANAELKVVPITAEDKNTEDQYKEVEQKLQEKAKEDEYDIAGFLAYDITFVDEDGNETEPGGEVKVSIDYKEAAIPESISEEDAANAEVTVLHLEEDEKGEVKEVVDMAQDEKVDVLATTEENKVERAEVRTESFSVYAITWWDYTQIYVHYVDTNGEDISENHKINEDNRKNNQWYKIESGGSGSLELDVEINGYDYQYAYVLDDENDSRATHIQRNTKESYWRTLYYKNGNNGYGQEWNIGYAQVGNDWEYGYHLYLVYSEENTEDDELTTVRTLDNDEHGITMTMTDLEENQQTQLLGGGGLTAQVGSTTYYNVEQGILQNMLNQYGYPILSGKKAYNNQGGRTRGSSLQNLFSNQDTQTVNNLLLESVYKDTGYYEYSSFANYAYLNKDNNFIVYDALGTPQKNNSSYFYNRGNFFPYNIIRNNAFSQNRNLYGENGESLEPGDENYNERLYLVGAGSQGVNHHFAMTMNAEFYQPENGQVEFKNKTSDMIYEFNGDDDLWVFIDNVLILDIGGIHDAHSGYINFATGEVHVELGTNSGGTIEPYESNIKELYRQAGVFPDGSKWDDALVDNYFTGNTFKDYTRHTMKMFYMERGAGASNLHMRFNLQTIPDGTITVAKKLGNTDKEKYANENFKFKLYVEQKADGWTSENPVYNGIYGLVTAETIDDWGFTTDLRENGVSTGDSIQWSSEEEGVFLLKPDQSVVISGLKATQHYYVEEIGVESDRYDEIEINNAIVEGEDKNGNVIEKDEETGTAKITSAKNTVYERPVVTFTNNCSSANRNELQITKAMAQGQSVGEDDEFTFKIELESVNGSLTDYVGPYYLKRGENYYYYDNDGQLVSNGPVGRVCATTNNGLIPDVKVGDIVSITQVLSGTSFRVTEIDPNTGLNTPKYGSPTYEVKPGTAGEINNTGGASGIILLGENAEVTVTNRYKPEIVVKKEWEPSSPSDVTEIQVGLYKLNGQEYMPTDQTLKLTSPGWSGKFEGLESGIDYTVKELQEVSNSGDAEFTIGGKYYKGVGEGQSVEIGGSNYSVNYETSSNGQITTITITNSIADEWKIVKKSSSKNSDGTNADVPAGAKFTLTNSKDNICYDGEVLEENQGVISWSRDGVLVENSEIEAGTYVLKEVQAPAGFAISNEEWTLTFAAKGAVPTIMKGESEYTVEPIEENGKKVYTFIFENTPIFDLPSAGSSGIFGYMMGGTLLLMAGTLILYKMKRKEVQES